MANRYVIVENLAAIRQSRLEMGIHGEKIFITTQRRLFGKKL
jgi:hypothetical protein